MKGKKVLGLNFGRNKGMNRKFIDLALEAAKEAGAETQLINTCNLNIGRCIGCGVCSKNSREKGSPTVECVIKDDYQMVREAFLDADSVIVAVPVYVLAPPGQYKNLLDRLGPACDYAQTIKEAMKRRTPVPNPENPAILTPRHDTDLVEKFDARFHKPRGIAYISLGGAVDTHWVSMGIQQLKLLGFPIGAHIIDEMNIHNLKKIFSDEAFRISLEERAKQLGKNVAEASGKHPRDVKFMGDDPGICPTCHGRILTLNPKMGKGGKWVECPLCGIQGELTIEDGKVKVDFPVEDWFFSRFMFGGLLEHTGYGNLVNPPRN